MDAVAGRVTRRVGPALLVVLVALGLLWPVAWAWLQTASTPTASDPVTISDYTAGYAVAGDGTLQAREQITTEFPGGRHGIFRYWDLADAADPHVRYVPTIASVTLDGQPEPYVLSWKGGYRFLVARIGDPDVLLAPGTHVYTITYTVPGSISPATTSAAAPFATSVGQDVTAPGSAFLWSVVASGWEMSMGAAGVTVTLPEPSGTVQCATDPWGVPGPCTVEGAGSATVLASATALAPRTGMVLRATMASPAPPRATLPWSVTWDPVLGRTPTVTWALVVLAAGAMALGVVLASRTREEPPGFGVQYEPPAGLGPVQAVYIDTEDEGPSPLVASVLHLADRGLVRLERPTARHWRVTSTASPGQWALVDEVTRSIAADLGLTTGGSFDADESVAAGKALQQTEHTIGPAVRDWSRRAGLMQSSPAERASKALWGLALLAALLLMALPALVAWMGLPWVVPTLAAAPAALFVIGGVGLVSPTVGQRHTAAGRLEWARSGGFRRLLSTPSAEERFDFAARQDAFISFVPYAVAFGVAEKWAEKYRAATGTDPPIPTWYPVVPGTSGSHFYSGGDFSSFSHAVTASVGAYVASQAASSSGGGGGGGFGGGGGGGGGSW